MTWVIAAISVHDAMLVIVNRQVIAEEERNPLGRWLLTRQSGNVWLFVLAKLLGTAVVCAVLVRLYQWRMRVAMAVASALVCFQLGLLLFLSLK
jgi:hypothetical protein